jgi:hypothetical protein
MRRACFTIGLGDPQSSSDPAWQRGSVPNLEGKCPLQLLPCLPLFGMLVIEVQVNMPKLSTG